MQSVIQVIHNSSSIVFLTLTVYTIAHSLKKSQRQDSWSKSDHFLALAVVITMYLQMALGSYLFISAQYFGNELTSNKSFELRFWPIEHFFIMIFALLIAQIGFLIAINSKHAKVKHKLIYKYYSTALFFVIVSLAMIILG